MMEIDLNDKTTSGQPAEIKLALDDVAPAKKSKAIKPTLGEKLYADRLVKGLHPEVAEDDETVTAGVKAAMVEFDEASHLIEYEGEQSSLAKLAKSLGYDGNISVGSLEDGIRFYQKRTTEACIELGKRLMLLKEITPHGEFTQRIELLGINVKLGRKFMQAAQKFSKDFSKSVLNKIGSQTKFLELLVLDDDEIETLEAGGSVRGVELDDIECMSVSELRAKLRHLEGTTGKQINNLNAEIERTGHELSRLKSKQRLTNFEEMTEMVRDECMHLQAGCELNLNSLQKLFEQVFYDEKTPEQELRVEQVCVAVSVAASRAFSILETIRELVPEGYLPARIQGQHILMPEEAERWLLDSKMLESKHEAEKLARDVKRESLKPKGRGRPAGAKNKVEE